MRPTSLDFIVGQKHLFGKDAALRKMIQNASMPHCVFFGPAGSGKTSAARAIGLELDMPYKAFNATSLKIDDIRSFIKEFAHRLRKPLVFIDEIHRLSKNQEEVLLPYMEDESIILLSASTQNPYYSLTQAFRSRSMIFEFKPLSTDDLKSLLHKACDYIEYCIDDDAQDYLIYSSSGDARAMLQLLDCALCVSKHVSLSLLKNLRPQAMQAGAYEESRHYDIASAFIKSLRGSDENAAIYYLALWLNEGEDVAFIARRMMIFASEDIGNANPHALGIAVATFHAVSNIGMPEARIILSQCAIYLAASPKSNAAYKAINAAIEYVQKGAMEIPKNICHNHQGYLYPHDYGGWVKQDYLSKHVQFVEMKGIGYEKTLLEWLAKIRQTR